MPNYRIARTPRGEAPEEVRRKCIGITLSFDIPHEESSELNLVDGSIQPRRALVTTPARAALIELEKKSTEAAKWFYNNLSASFLEHGNFTFVTSELDITELKVSDR